MEHNAALINAISNVSSAFTRATSSECREAAIAYTIERLERYNSHGDVCQVGFSAINRGDGSLDYYYRVWDNEVGQYELASVFITNNGNVINPDNDEVVAYYGPLDMPLNMPWK